MFTRSKFISLLIPLSAALLVAPGMSAVASAQGADDELEEIIVTGSRIKRNTFNYSTPVTVIDAVEISATGTTNLGDLLQTLPQAISRVNNANSAFDTTQSGLNLTDLRFLRNAPSTGSISGSRSTRTCPTPGPASFERNSRLSGTTARWT